MRRTWRAILEAILNKALSPEMCKAIIRKSGFRPGGDVTLNPRDIPPWFPKGGYPGDVLLTRRNSQFQSFWQAWQYRTASWVRAKLFYKAIDDDPDYYAGKQIPLGTTTIPEIQLSGSFVVEQGGAQLFEWLQAGNASFDLVNIGRDYPYFGDTPSHFYRFSARNARHDVGSSDFLTKIWDGETKRELLVWENIPAGTWHYPYNVDWFVTKRDLSARLNQNRRRQMKMRTGWVEGSPPADLILRYSTDAQNWTDLMSVDLAGTSLVHSTGWLPFPEGPTANDVFLGLFLRARSPIAKLHMGQVDAFMRWEPVNFRDMIPYDEFGNAYHEPRGHQTLEFDLAPPGRLTPHPDGRYFFVQAKAAPESEQYWPEPIGPTSSLTPKGDLATDYFFYPGLFGIPGWTNAWIMTRDRPSEAKITCQMVASAGPDGYQIVPEGDGIRVQMGYDWFRQTPSLGVANAHQGGKSAHMIGHVLFGMQHGGDGIMRPESERGPLTSQNSNVKGIARPNENDVYSLYRWLWG